MIARSFRVSSASSASCGTGVARVAQACGCMMMTSPRDANAALAVSVHLTRGALMPDTARTCSYARLLLVQLRSTRKTFC